jgi:hypothetical protein
MAGCTGEGGELTGWKQSRCRSDCLLLSSCGGQRNVGLKRETRLLQILLRRDVPLVLGITID